jgi:hypothetical protein
MRLRAVDPQLLRSSSCACGVDLEHFGRDAFE